MVIKTIHSTINNFLETYKKWIMANPQLIKDIESAMVSLSYLTAGRFNNSMLMSELIYSIPNLLVLFNDVLMYSGKYVHLKLPQFECKIKIWLTVLEYTDVLFEISAKKLWGEAGRWIIIAFIQMLKTVMRLLLVHLYEERVTKNLPIEPVNREKFKKEQQQIENGFTLKRCGTVVRSIKASEPISIRLWAPAVNPDEELNTHLQSSKKTLLLAETLYIAKPLLHLSSIYLTGQKQWQPWFLSLIIDIASLKLLSTDAKMVSLSKEEMQEIDRRKTALLLYLLRSPFYDKYSRRRIYAFLRLLSSSIPFARLLIEPIERYLPHWQNIYFYTWSH